MNAYKVLIAEDEPYVTRVLKLVLQKEGYDVTVVKNGKEALQVYTEQPPDVLVTDVKMPHMGGRELVKTIRGLENSRNIPIVVMTSTLESENRDWLHDVGNVSFLGKPVSPKNLLRVVNNLFIQSKVP